MDIKKFFTDSSIGGLLKHAAIAVGILLLFSIIYFYIYLPNITNHGESIVVPDLKGIKVEELESFLKKHKLRFSVNDSAYTDTLPVFAVLRQFPTSGSKVKENRIIYVSLNRQSSPPTLPMPDLTDGSLVQCKSRVKKQ